MADATKNTTCTIHEDSVRYSYDGAGLHIEWEETRDGERQIFGRDIQKMDMPAGAQSAADNMRAAVYTKIKTLRGYS